MHHKELLKQYPIISDQIATPAMHVVLREFEQTLANRVNGDVVELGCYIGTTTVFLRRLLNVYESTAALHAYDSFVGLPDKSPQDNSPAGMDFKAGELLVSKKQFIQTFRDAHLQPPIIHKAWFSDLTNEQMPEKISFAFLDGDFYESIKDSLKLVWPRLAPGAIITIDDYGREALPGVVRAVSDYFNGQPPQIHHEHNIGIIRT